MNTGSTMKIWFEELPELCPEDDAKIPNGEVFYRLIENEVIKCQDFWSHRKLWPHKAFNITECRALSVSVFEKLPECEKLLLLPLHGGKRITEVTLTKDAGLVKRTGKQSGHHSWWRSEAFDPVANASLIQSNADHG